MKTDIARVVLPKGPWAYRPDKHDDWGTVRDADGHPVANTCPPGLAQDFRDARLQQAPSVTAWKAGPPQARAIAELLIRAELEADPTPVDEAWLLKSGGTKIGSYFEFSDDQMQPVRLRVYKSGGFDIRQIDDEGKDHNVEPRGLLTRGAVRRLLSALGIEPKEPTK